MKFDLSLEATLDEENGKLTATVKGDVPDAILASIEKLATAASSAVTEHLAAKAAKTLK